jgi:hypothetical protein
VVHRYSWFSRQMTKVYGLWLAEGYYGFYEYQLINVNYKFRVASVKNFTL